MIEILATDIRWPGPYHVEEGPECWCSRCSLPIEEHEIAIRAWPEDDPNRYSYRFHPACLGMRGGWPLDDADFPPFVLGDADTPCAFCGKAGCEGTCTGAILARDASREDTP